MQEILYSWLNFIYVHKYKTGRGKTSCKLLLRIPSAIYSSLAFNIKGGHPNYSYISASVRLNAPDICHLENKYTAQSKSWQVGTG